MNKLLKVAACLGALSYSFSAVSAQAQLPNPLRLIVPFSAGGSNDVFARAMGAKLTKKLGTTVVVENKPGAGGAIGASEVARSAPNGGTLLFTSVSFVTNAATQEKLPYDLVKDFAPIAVVAKGAMVLVVGASTPYKSTEALLKDARQHSGKLNYGSAGVGSIGQLSAELLSSMAKTEMVHVPYKGISNAVTDMIGGRVEAMITTPASVSGPLSAHEIRALAVTSTERSKFFPDLPTIAETVPGYSVDVWWGMYAPKSTPPAILATLNDAIREVSNEPDMRELFAREATEPTQMDASQATTYVHEELNKWRSLATDRHIVAASH